MPSIKIEWFRSETENIFRLLAQYQTTMESQLDAVQTIEQKKLHDWIQSIEFNLDDWDIESNTARDEFTWTYKIMFPRSLRYSYIVLLFLVFENQLNGLCDSIKERLDLPIRVTDLNGNVIERAKKYLHKMAHIPSLHDQLWENVEDLSKVRNCIVHGLGKVELSKDQKRLRDLSEKGCGLSIGNFESLEEGLVIIAPEYCLQAVSNVQELFRALFEAAGYGPAINISQI